ncbi:MAG TPA: PAS domain-containing protein [Terriglobia bacterium]|nr:PAS domain-containing protein [Terriglobia bacterium]
MQPRAPHDRDSADGVPGPGVHNRTDASAEDARRDSESGFHQSAGSRAEEALRQSEERLRLVIDTVPALIHTGRPDGYLDFFNQRWLDYVGFSLKDLAGWKWTTAIHPEDVAVMVEKWRASVATGKPYEHEARVRRADGEYRWMFLRKVPLRDERGNIVKWYGTSIDIEDRKRAEEQLRRSEAYLASGQRLSHTGSWALNLSSGELYWSQETYRLFGFDPAKTTATLNEAFLERIHPEDRSRIEQDIKGAAAHKKPYGTDYRIVLPDGQTRYIHDVVNPVTNEAGQVIERYGLAMDVTERKQAEESLRQLSDRLLHAQDEERRRIARELHDATAQSLAALAINLGVVETSSRELKPPARNALADSFALVESCTREIRTIAYLMHPPLLNELGLASALRWYVRGFAERSGIHVKLEIAAKVGRVPDDMALALYRVVQEGLANIHRHSGSPSATIRLARSATTIRLRIEDSGRGISSGDVLRSPGGRASEPATGVGIAGMRERVRQLGGELEVRSGKARKSGRIGTRLTVVLPLKKREPAGPAKRRTS